MIRALVEARADSHTTIARKKIYWMSADVSKNNMKEYAYINKGKKKQDQVV